MSTIAASAVKDLRSQTGYPMIDCKQALVDSNGDFDRAKSLLRDRLGAADKNKVDSGQNGLISALYDKNEFIYTFAEIGTETDFAAKNPTVIDACEEMIRQKTFNETIEHLRALTGENIVLRRAETSRIYTGRAGLYVHHNRKIAALVAFSQVDYSSPTSEELMRDIAMHVVAASPFPVCVNSEDVPADKIETERVFLQEKAKASGKPEAIQNKIVEGGLSKFRSSLALLEQPYIKDPSKKVKDLLPQGLSITHFIRWEI